MGVEHGYSLATVRMLKRSLDEVRATYGTIIPRHIVEYARPEESPLHTLFQWDDSIAAEKYRLIQASSLVRRVQVMVERGETHEPVRVYLNVVKENVRQYVPVDEVLEDEVTAREFMAEMRRDLERMLHRYEKYEACSHAIELLKQAIDTLMREAESEAA